MRGVQEEHCWTKRNAIVGVKLTIFSLMADLPVFVLSIWPHCLHHDH